MTKSNKGQSQQAPDEWQDILRGEQSGSPFEKRSNRGSEAPDEWNAILMGAEGGSETERSMGQGLQISSAEVTEHTIAEMRLPPSFLEDSSPSEESPEDPLSETSPFATPPEGDFSSLEKEKPPARQAIPLPSPEDSLSFPPMPPLPPPPGPMNPGLPSPPPSVEREDGQQETNVLESPALAVPETEESVEEPDSFEDLTPVPAELSSLEAEEGSEEQRDRESEEQELPPPSVEAVEAQPEQLPQEETSSPIPVAEEEEHLGSALSHHLVEEVGFLRSSMNGFLTSFEETQGSIHALLRWLQQRESQAEEQALSEREERLLEREERVSEREEQLAEQLDSRREEFTEGALESQNELGGQAASVSEILFGAEQLNLLRDEVFQLFDYLSYRIGTHWNAGERSPVLQELNGVQERVLEMLRRLGIRRIESRSHFDPLLHRVLQESEAFGPEEDGAISSVFRQGFQSDEKVLRPAEVEIKRYPSKN